MIEDSAVSENFFLFSFLEIVKTKCQVNRKVEYFCDFNSKTRAVCFLPVLDTVVANQKQDLSQNSNDRWG